MQTSNDHRGSSSDNFQSSKFQSNCKRDLVQNSSILSVSNNFKSNFADSMTFLLLGIQTLAESIYFRFPMLDSSKTMSRLRFEKEFAVKYVILILLIQHVVSNSSLLPHINLDLRSNIVYSCNYSDPISSYSFESSGIPCSSMYVNSTINNNFVGKFSAPFVESIYELKTVRARRCYKVKLITSCEQKWFSQNEIKRRYEALDVDRAECEGNGACMHCTIDTFYPAPNCKTFTWGIVEETVVKVFGSDAVAYQDNLGTVSYGGISTTDEMISLGGSLKEKLYYRKVDVAEPRMADFIINPSTGDLISFELKMLLRKIDKTITFRDKQWYVYDNNHLVEKQAIDKQIEDLLTNKLVDPSKTTTTAEPIPSSRAIDD